MVKLVALVALLGGCRAESAAPAAPLPLPAPPTEIPACGPAELRDAAGHCRPVEAAVVAPGGRAYWVDAGDPEADDANPGTRSRPWRTIGRATGPEVLQPGDGVVVRAGVYRETVSPRVGGSGPERRVTYAAYPGERVVVTGADPADSGWTRDRTTGAWRRAWTGEPLVAYLDPAGGAGDVFRRELLVAGGTVLRPVYRAADLRAGTFYVEGPDTAPRAILARFPSDASPEAAGAIEIGRRPYLFRPLGRDPEPACGASDQPGWLRIVGFTFRHAANRAQWGSVCAGREGALVDDVAIEWTNGMGLDGSGRGHVFRRVRADHHGQLGLGARCTDCTYEGGTLVGNNWKGHDPFWEAGGAKWRETTGTVVRGYVVADNEGPGLWFDGENTRNTIEDCRVTNNAVAGIMLELATTRTLVQHTLVERTRWRAWSGAGLLSQAASANAVVHVTFAENASSGLWLRLDPERRAPDGAYVVANTRFDANAQRTDVEGRELQVEGTSPAHVRSNRFEGNLYARHPVEDWRNSTFFLDPVAGAEAGFRGNSLATWQRLVGGDAQARLVDRDAARRTPMPAVQGVDLRGYGAPSAPYRPAPGIGADVSRLPAPVSE